MLRRAHDVGGRADLDEFPVVQHGEPVGDLIGDAEVVGDEQDRAPEVVAQFAQQIQQLRLHGDVERGGRLVGHQQRRLIRDGDGRHHALAQTAGELVRVYAQPQLGVPDAHGLQQPDRFRVVARGLADLPTDPHGRVQRRHRILEDRAEHVAAHGAQLVAARGQQIDPADGDAPLGDRVGFLGQQPEQAERENALAGTGFANEPEDLARTGSAGRHGRGPGCARHCG